MVAVAVGVGVVVVVAVGVAVGVVVGVLIFFEGIAMASGIAVEPSLYPVRDADFVVEYLRTLNRFCVAEEIGTDAFAILMIVVDAESRRRFQSPPRFHLCHLSDRLGLSRSTVSKAVRRAVESGWLHRVDVPGSRFLKAFWAGVPDRIPA